MNHCYNIFSGSIQVHTILYHSHNFPIQKEIRYSANSQWENFYGNKCLGGLINTFLVHGRADIQNQLSFLQFVIVCSSLYTRYSISPTEKIIACTSFSSLERQLTGKRCNNPIKQFEILSFFPRASRQTDVRGPNMMGVH